MSNKLILEFQDINGGQIFITEILSFVFSDFTHIPNAAALGVKSKSEIVSDLVVSRIVDQYSPFFFSQLGRVFPKILLTVPSEGGKSFTFTFLTAQLNSYSINGRNAPERVENTVISFAEMSVKEAAPKSENYPVQNRRKTSDVNRKRAMTL